MDPWRLPPPSLRSFTAPPPPCPSRGRFFNRWPPQMLLPQRFPCAPPYHSPPPFLTPFRPPPPFSMRPAPPPPPQAPANDEISIIVDQWEAEVSRGVQERQESNRAKASIGEFKSKLKRWKELIENPDLANEASFNKKNYDI